MNEGFTKLEIIMFGVILLFAIGFLGTKNINPLINRENLLRQRFNKFVNLMNDKNYSEAYNFYSSSTKNKVSLEDYIKDAKESSNIGKQTVTINKIVIEDNTGYIDRNNIACEDQDCKTKKELRGYKRWILENGNWYYSPPDPLCIRKEMYNMPPEFKRALSIIEQKINYREQTAGRKTIDYSFFNCLDIQYANIPDAEGYFAFDPNNSSFDKLQIYVDYSYKENDDLLSAFLLSHETLHARVFLDKYIFGKDINCIDNEVFAFMEQLAFLQSLNSQEKESIDQRLKKGYGSLNNPLQIIWDLVLIATNAENYCANNQKCYENKLKVDIKNYITRNPYYQKQCNLN